MVLKTVLLYADHKTKIKKYAEFFILDNKQFRTSKKAKVYSIHITSSMYSYISPSSGYIWTGDVIHHNLDAVRLSCCQGRSGSRSWVKLWLTVKLRLKVKLRRLNQTAWQDRICCDQCCGAGPFLVGYIYSSEAQGSSPGSGSWCKIGI